MSSDAIFSFWMEEHFTFQLPLQLDWGHAPEFWQMGMCRCEAPGIFFLSHFLFLPLGQLKAENPVEDSGRSWEQAEPPERRCMDPRAWGGTEHLEWSPHQAGT